MHHIVGPLLIIALIGVLLVLLILAGLVSVLPGSEAGRLIPVIVVLAGVAALLIRGIIRKGAETRRELEPFGAPIKHPFDTIDGYRKMHIAAAVVSLAVIAFGIMGTLG